MIKVGVVGLSRGQGLLAALRTHPNVEISAVCDIDQAVLAELGDEIEIPDAMRFQSYEELLESPVEAVTIATPIGFHADQSVSAMEAGKHVLCEQTQAYTVEDCESVVAAERRTGGTYMMAENYTYFHFIQEWQSLVDAGRLGEIYYAESEYLHEIIELLVDPTSGERQWRYTRPPIWYCAHCLGPLLTLMDDRIVQATGAHTGHRAHPDEPGEGFLDMEVGLFRTQKGAMIKILRSQVGRRYPHLVWYSLHGAKGYIENGRAHDTAGLFFSADDMEASAGAEALPWNVSDPQAPPEAYAGGHGTSEFLMVRDFIDAISDGRKAPIDSVRAADFTLPGLIAHQAAEAGGVWLDVPLLG